jgi:DNA polymerase III subunit alpha
MSSAAAVSSNPGFTHLHLHTQYSLLDGAIRMDDLAPTIKEKGMDSVAVTDHGNMYGAVHFYNTAKKHGVKPIMGVEAYVTKDRHDRNERSSAHMIMLAKNNEGYKNLSLMVSMGFMQGFYYKPRIDSDLLRKHSKGIYATSACLGGVVNKALMKEGESAAAEAAKHYASLFEPGHFFLELQDNGYAEQERSNAALLNISEITGIPVIATADSHYLKPEDSAAHEILMCIGQNQGLEEFRQKFKHSDKLYVRGPEEMWNAFARMAPQAVENTVRVARDCNVELDLSQVYLPNFGVPDGHTRESFIEKVAVEGLERRISEAHYAIDRAAYRQRLDYELGVIVKMGFAGYFLIVWDFIKYAKDGGIPVGPGRGSGAGSLVAWSLRITDLDPIPYDLLFERFLNPERVSMPDFDIDFCQDRRGEVINYVSEKYGRDNVGQIVTYSELSAKSGIKAVGRVMGLPFAEVNELTKLIPNLVEGKKVSIDKALELEPKLTEIQKTKPVYKDVVDITRALEGLNASTGMHAAGIVIGDKPLWDYVPVCRGKNGELVTQFAKDEVEQAGLVKFDFLGLKTLTVVANAVKHVRRRADAGPLGANAEFEIERAPLTDPSVYRLIASGDTDGVFQLESSGFKELLKRLKPDCFEDIVAAVALYRPGPLDAGMVDDYIARKHGKQKVSYPHAVCEEILKPTYGVIVYQEQVMRIAVALSGFTMGQADTLRKAMGKKKADVMAKMRAQFVQGALKLNGMPEKDGDELFTQIEKFAGYAFNKSHSAAYAVITYQTAFLKTYYPTEFMTALLSTEMGSRDNVVKYIQTAREAKIRVLPPDVKRSGRDFSVAVDGDSRHILFGLGAVNGVGDAAIEAIAKAREQGFVSLFDFCDKVDGKKLNKKVLESLVKSGALDALGKPRAQLFGALERALEAGARTQRDRESGQTSLFGMFAAGGGGAAVKTESYPEIPEWTEKQKLAFEKEALGFYVSGHPLDRYADDLPRLCSVNTANLAAYASRQQTRFTEVAIGGVITAYRERPLKSGDGRMAFITLEDLHGTIEVLVFSKTFNECEMILKSDEPVIVRGAVMVEGEENTEVKIRAASVELLAEARAKKAKRFEMEIPVYELSDDKLVQLREILTEFKGNVPARLTITQPDQFETVIALPEQLAVSPTEELLIRVDGLFGRRVVRLA